MKRVQKNKSTNTKPLLPVSWEQNKMQVKSIDVYGIEARLRKSKIKEDKEVLHYINQLKEALARQQELTGHAISKIKELSKPLGDK